MDSIIPGYETGMTLFYLTGTLLFVTMWLFLTCYILKIASSFLTRLLCNLILVIIALWLMYAFGRYVDDAARKPLIDLADAADVERIRTTVRDLFDYKKYTVSSWTSWLSSVDTLRLAMEYYNNATSWIIKR